MYFINKEFECEKYQESLVPCGLMYLHIRVLHWHTSNQLHFNTNISVSLNSIPSNLSHFQIYESDVNSPLVSYDRNLLTSLQCPKPPCQTQGSLENK